MTTWLGYEFTNRLDLPPLGDWYLGGPDLGVYWDREHNYPVDFDALVEAGYCVPVRITETKEYL